MSRALAALAPRAGARPLVAVLGLGEMGSIHAAALARSRGIRLGLASRRADALEAAAAALHADVCWPSYADALADPQVDAVVIATPPKSHPGLIVDAVAAGKRAIFSEKPLGLHLESISGAAAAVREAGVVRFMSGFMRRWDTGYRQGMAAAVDGKMGRPIALKATSGDASYPEKYMRPGVSPEGAMLRDLAVHDVDLARWLLRSEVKSVFASAAALSYPKLADFRDHDLVMGFMEMENGAKVSMHLSRALSYGYNVTTELVMEKSSVMMGELKETAASFMDRGQVKTDIAPAFGERFHHAFQAQMNAFVRLVCAESDTEAAEMMKEESSYADFIDGIRVTEVAEALVKSVETGKMEMVERSTY